MAWFDEKQLVDILTIASILSAAAFGALGLFTDFKKDGKVTRYGRMAVGGIMLSAAFSIGVGLLQGRIEAKRSEAAAEKEAVDREREGRRFADQINRLERLNRSLFDVNRAASELQQGMRNSLRSQGLLLGRARDSMLLTARLGAQERENTGRVLHGLWEESTRVTSSSVVATVVYFCWPVQPGREFPRLMTEASFARLRIGSPRTAAGLGVPMNTFTEGPLLVGDDVVELLSRDQQTTVYRHRSPNGDAINQISRFTAFTADDWAWIGRPESWEGAAIDFRINGFDPGLVATADAAMPADEAGGKEKLAERFVLLPRDRDDDRYVVATLPCQVTLYLSVHDRELARADGILVALRTHHDDISGQVVVRFPIVETRRDVFPRFARH